MIRCSICDYVMGMGNTYLPDYRLSNRVTWNSKTREYVCSDCRRHINDTISENDIDAHTHDGYFKTPNLEQGY